MTQEPIQPGQWRWMKPVPPEEGEPRGEWRPGLVVTLRVVDAVVAGVVVEIDGRDYGAHPDMVGELCHESEFLPAAWAEMQARAERVRRNQGLKGAPR